MKYAIEYDSPVGPIWLAEENGALTDLRFKPVAEASLKETPLLREAQSQLERYFSGTLCRFDLPLSPAGTPFQKACWQALQTIPYGETRSYSDIAAAVGNPKACRAVGMANNKNPISIIVPCHRVIGKSGSLVGYGGGLENKEKLLELEQKHK
jgi:methylated-DNA-[protein]-cysteine S-methyltransferase